MFNPYEELGLPRDADATAIKRAYRKRASQTHPDKGGSSEAFARANRAMRVLKDPARRAKFDAIGQVDDERASQDPDMLPWAMIGDLVGKAIGAGDDIFRHDAIEGLRKSIREHIAALKDQKTKLLEVSGRARKFALRLERDKGENRLRRMAEYHAERAKEMAGNVDAQIKIDQRAIELLKPYRFVQDVVQQITIQDQQRGFFRWSSTT